MWMPSTSTSQRTLNGLICLVNNMYITYAIQQEFTIYIYLFDLITYVSLMLSLENITSTQNVARLQ